MERTSLLQHLASTERLDQLHCIFARQQGRLTLSAFREAIKDVAPDFLDTDSGATLIDSADTTVGPEAYSVLLPLLFRSQAPAHAPLAEDNREICVHCVDGGNAESSIVARLRFPTAQASALAPPRVPPPPPLEAASHAGALQQPSFPTVRDRAVTLGASPQHGELVPVDGTSGAATPQMSVSGFTSCTEPQPQPPQGRSEQLHELPTYRARFTSIQSSNSGTGEDALKVSNRVSRLRLRNELSQGEHGDPVRRLFYQLDTDQSGFVEWDAFMELLVDETRHHDAALAEDHRSYVFSRSRGGRPIDANAGEAYANTNANAFRRQLEHHRTMVSACSGPSPVRTSPQRRSGRRPQGGVARTQLPRTGIDRHEAPMDMSLVRLLDGLPSHPTLFALSSRTLPLALLDKATLNLVKTLTLSHLGGAAPDLVDYLPQPDLLFTYSTGDRCLRAVVALESSTVCVFTTAPLCLEHTVRRLRTDPRQFPTTIFCGMSNGDVLLVETPSTARADTSLIVRKVLAGLHTPESGGVADFVLGSKGQIFSFGHDRRLRTVDIETGRIAEVARLGDGLRFLAVNKTRQMLVGVCVRGVVRVWDPKSQTANSGNPLHLHGHRAHIAEVVGLVSVPDRPEVLTVDMAGEVRVWDLRQLACVQSGYLDGRVDDDADADVRYGTAAAEEDLENAHMGNSSGVPTTLVAQMLKAKTITKQYLCAFRGATFFEQTRELVGFTAERLYCMRSNCEVDERLCDWDVVLYPMYISQTNTFVLQGPSRTTFWDGTFGHRRAVVDRAAEGSAPPASREVTACCVDGVSGHLFLATTTGDIEMHGARAMRLAEPLRHMRVADGYVTDMQYCEGIRLLVGVSTAGVLFLSSEDPRNRFTSNMCLSRAPLHSLTVSEDLGLAAFADEHHRITVQDVKKLSGATYQLALDRRTLSMTLTGDASALVTAHEAQLLVIWSVPPALEVFAQLAVFDGHTHALSTAKFVYHCFYMGHMDKAPALSTARRPDSSASRGRRSRPISPGGDGIVPRAHLSDTVDCTDDDCARGDPNMKMDGATARNRQLLSSLLESTVRDWTAARGRACAMPTDEKHEGPAAGGDRNLEDQSDDGAAMSAIEPTLMRHATAKVASDECGHRHDPWNGARTDVDITALAFHDASHHLFVGYADGHVQIYALCPLLQVYQIRSSTYESRPRFSLAVPTTGDIQLGKTTPQLVAVVPSSAPGSGAVLALQYVSALKLVLCSSEDRSVTLRSASGEDVGFFSMRRMPPKEWLQTALDSSTENLPTADSPTAAATLPTHALASSPSTASPTPFRIRRVPSAPRRAAPASADHGRTDRADRRCCCQHKLRLKALAATFKVHDISFLSRSVAFCVNDSVRLGAVAGDSVRDRLARPPRAGTGGGGRPESTRLGRPRATSASLQTIVKSKRASLQDAPEEIHPEVAATSPGLASGPATRLHDELIRAVGGSPATRDGPGPACTLSSLPPLAFSPPLLGGVRAAASAEAVSAEAVPCDALRSKRARPGTAQAVAMRSFPLSPPPSRPLTSTATTANSYKSYVLRLGSAPSPLPAAPSPPSPARSTDVSDGLATTGRTDTLTLDGPAPLMTTATQIHSRITTQHPRAQPSLTARQGRLHAASTRALSRPRTGLTPGTQARAGRLGRPGTAPHDACQAALNRMVEEYAGELQRCLTGEPSSRRTGSRRPRPHSDHGREDAVSEALMKQAAFF